MHDHAEQLFTMGKPVELTASESQKKTERREKIKEICHFIWFLSHQIGGYYILMRPLYYRKLPHF